MGGRLSAINWTVTGGALLIILAAASAIPFSLWYWAAQYGNLGEITVYKFIMPISGSILAVLLGESVTVSLMVGLALVCLSIILINRPPITKPIIYKPNEPMIKFQPVITKEFKVEPILLASIVAKAASKPYINIKPSPVSENENISLKRTPPVN